jgi:typhasterol/6-deoxotyphasterol 2alpha-hydroxylase
LGTSSRTWLYWLDLQGYVRRMKRIGKAFSQFLEHVIEEHDERRRLEGDTFVARDMLDVLLQLADGPNLEGQLSKDNVKALTQVGDANKSLLFFSFFF